MLKELFEPLILGLCNLREQINPNFKKAMLNYVINGIPSLGSQQAYEFLQETTQRLPSDFRGELMTLGEYLRQEGVKQGMQQRDLEIARQMLHKGFDRTLIQEFTHLSDEEIEQLFETS